jgi:hypothetical protein
MGVMGNSKVAKQHWYGVMGVMGDSKVAKHILCYLIP